MNVGQIAVAGDGDAALASQADGAGPGQRVVTVSRAVALGDAGDFGGDQVRQRGPLLGREAIGADQADAHGFGVEVLGMGADFIDVAAGENRAISADNVVIADGVEFRILPGHEGASPLEAALDVPLVDDLGRIAIAGHARRTPAQRVIVRAGRAVDEDEVDWAHAVIVSRARKVGRGEVFHTTQQKAPR